MSNKLYNKKNPRFTWDDVKAWEDLHSQGMQYVEIAKEVGVSDGYVRGKCSMYRRKIKPLLNNDTPDTPESPTPIVSIPTVQEVKPQKKASLDDFTPREIIQYMYGLGYRIDKDGLYQIEIKKNRVKLSDII